MALNLQEDSIILRENSYGLSNGGLRSCHPLGQGGMGSKERW